eukprot:TRINITY_DN5958_c0_g1_i2.p1 TRINITY_DN5958_c0_g1~~TRINITY_DN5958_c0_g1_i2.p1  ORF type:complete len:385 (+),score=57.73 TRINITY_DN5958_c0_g1_i2:63-1217(+)
MPAFLAGMVMVSKVACGIGFLSGASAIVWESSDGLCGERVFSRADRARRMQRKKSIQSSKNIQHTWVSNLGNIDTVFVMKVFCGGVVVGSVLGAIWTGTHGVTTTSIPLTRESASAVCTFVGVNLILWAPTFGILTNDCEKIERGVPFYFLNNFILGTSWFLVSSMFGLKSIKRMVLCTTSGAAAVQLMIFVNRYGYFQSAKRVLYTGPITCRSHRWLIAAGIVSGNVLAVALATLPFYHPGNFLVWGITNPALMYTMCLAAEQEIECEQMETYKKTADESAIAHLQQRRFIRALLPMTGLPFAYVADRDDVGSALKTALAGMGAVGLGSIIYYFQDEWNAFISDERLKISTHDNTPISGIVSVSSKGDDESCDVSEAEKPDSM